MTARYLGIDIGAESIKVVELLRQNTGVIWTRREWVKHGKKPGSALISLLDDWDWSSVSGVAVTGRFCRLTQAPKVPVKESQISGYRFLYGAEPGTVVSLGSRSFSVLEIRASGRHVFRENYRCAQGTGTFLSRSVERFGMTMEQAVSLCTRVNTPASLSGRCPVVLKTDMTHLSNQGERPERILAGLFDAVCENVTMLINQKTSPATVRLFGGVARVQRVHDTLQQLISPLGMKLIYPADKETHLYLEALGCARIAAENSDPVPQFDKLLCGKPARTYQRLPGLATYLNKVERRSATEASLPLEQGCHLILGLDMGSTGSKALALEPQSGTILWQDYEATQGKPIDAAKQLLRSFLKSPAGKLPVFAFGVTGSGREVVASLLASCYGAQAVCVQNEIVAHAEGALHFDPDVDTIFEIGGQDAKYIGLVSGQVVEAALNEACSAGTGSFIEEQSRNWFKENGAEALGKRAIAASHSISHGEHCAVFMSEMIEEALAEGVEESAVIAGIYDSVIRNYLNRVKGNRRVGQVVFCQGAPFSSDALAAAVVRQTGKRVVIPPYPDKMGALGIALITRRSLPAQSDGDCDLKRIMKTRLKKKETFVCKSNQGCGQRNHCRIDRLFTEVEGHRQQFTWGGSCALWDQTPGKTKLPDLAPNPFLERRVLVENLLNTSSIPRAESKRVALAEDFVLKGLLPFFVTFFQQLGLNVTIHTAETRAILKRGVEAANVSFCAPMQLYHGLITTMAETNPDYLLLPMLKQMPHMSREPHSNLCPIVQGSSDILRWDLPEEPPPYQILNPVVDFDSPEIFSQSISDCCRQLSRSVGLKTGKKWKEAYRLACEAQTRFQTDCLELGNRALSYAKQHGLTPIIVLGRTYTVHSPLLNSRVPDFLRENGALPIPIDCYPIEDETPVYDHLYWHNSQLNMRAVYQIAQTSDQYSIWCSNYACGPDAFNQHFYEHLMEDRPFAVIETDGHTGDAGTKTRVEAFLHCVRQDQEKRKRHLSVSRRSAVKRHFSRAFNTRGLILREVENEGRTVLVPPMGHNADVLVSCLRGIGVPSESLGLPDQETLQLGRRHTSGKECVPFIITLGSLLHRLQRVDAHPEQQFAYFMPTTRGSCRFGMYHLAHSLILDQLDLRSRISLWSPVESAPFQGGSSGFNALFFMGVAAADALLEGLLYIRPTETVPEAANKIYRKAMSSILRMLETVAHSQPTVNSAIQETMSGRLFGCTAILREAGQEYAKIQERQQVPTVSLAGEIYVRCDPFANQFMIEELEKRGIRVHFAHFSEWLECGDYRKVVDSGSIDVVLRITTAIKKRILRCAFAAVNKPLRNFHQASPKEILESAHPYLRPEFTGEAPLTVGSTVHGDRTGFLNGALNVGPLECMPTKVAMSQFVHVSEQTGLPILTVAFNGDPIDSQQLDDFAYEVHSHFRSRTA